MPQEIPIYSVREVGLRFLFGERTHVSGLDYWHTSQDSEIQAAYYHYLP